MTIQERVGDRRRRDNHRPSHQDKRSDLLINVRYTNTLPDVPFEPKFLKFPFDSKRYVNYVPTSLEENYKFDIITDHDLGVHIDLIDPDTYRIDKNAKLDQRDEALLLEDDLVVPPALATSSNTPSGSTPSAGPNTPLNISSAAARSSRHAKAVPWLRRTEYISTEYNRFAQSTDKAESKIGYRMQKLMKEEEEDLYKDRDSQIKAIDTTFQAAKRKTTKHYSKPNVYAIKELPVYPDFSLWRHPCAQVLFDSDPYISTAQTHQLRMLQKMTGTQAPIVTSAHKEKLMSQAMIRGMMDESGNQFVAYFLPSDPTLEKFNKDAAQQLDFTPEEMYYYQMTREYNWNVKNKASKGYEENYFFVFRPTLGGQEVFGANAASTSSKSDTSPVKTTIAFYNELETRVRLSKRRLMQGQQSQVNRTKLAVRYRPFNENELISQQTRLCQILTSHNLVQEEEATEETEDSKDQPPENEGNALTPQDNPDMEHNKGDQKTTSKQKDYQLSSSDLSSMDEDIPKVHMDNKLSENTGGIGIKEENEIFGSSSSDLESD